MCMRLELEHDPKGGAMAAAAAAGVFFLGPRAEVLKPPSSCTWLSLLVGTSNSTIITSMAPFWWLGAFQDAPPTFSRSVRCPGPFPSRALTPHRGCKPSFGCPREVWLRAILPRIRRRSAGSRSGPLAPPFPYPSLLTSVHSPGFLALN